MRFSHQSLVDRQSAVFCPLICPLHSKKRVDERRDGRSGSQKDQSAQCEEHDDDREQPKFLPLLQETQEFQDKVTHVVSPFIANGVAWQASTDGTYGMPAAYCGRSDT